MIDDQRAVDDGATGRQQRTVPDRSGIRLLLGVVALTIAAGSALFRFAGSGFRTDLGLVIPMLGGALTGTLLGEYVSPGFGSSRTRWLLVPSVELAIAYASLGVLFAAIHGGFVTVGVVSGLLLVCSFVAVVATAPRLREALADAVDDDTID